LKPVGPAENFLYSLGITHAHEIDIEAIAWAAGARVRDGRLASCEARIIGFQDQAIITVRGVGDWRRRRFSIAHELGHWHYHRGRSSLCRPSEIGNPASNNSVERQADNYAADLLMPSYIFKELMGHSSPCSFEIIDDLSEQFSTSRVATALRYVYLTQLPCILICHDAKGRRWFQRSRMASDRWFPRSELDANSHALEVLLKRTRQNRPLKIGAQAWFDRRDAERHYVFEHSRASFGDEILTLVTLSSDMAA